MHTNLLNVMHWLGCGSTLATSCYIANKGKTINCYVYSSLAFTMVTKHAVILVSLNARKSLLLIFAVILYARFMLICGHAIFVLLPFM